MFVVITNSEVTNERCFLIVKMKFTKVTLKIKLIKLLNSNTYFNYNNHEEANKLFLRRYFLAKQLEYILISITPNYDFLYKSDS
jgi:hypothetical protein